MKRRRFLETVLGCGAVLWTRPLRARVVPRVTRWVEALRGRSYPGRVRPIAPDEVRRPGPWAG